MGLKQGLDIIIDAARILYDENIIFVMAGFGAALDSLKEKSVGMKNVVWLPLQPYEKLNEFLNVADIHLLPQSAGAADLVMPSKLTGMLSSGKSIIATANQGTELYRVLDGIAVVSRPDDPKLFAKAILKLASDASLRDKYGRAGRAYAVKHLNIDAVMHRFESDLKKLVGFK